MLLALLLLFHLLLLRLTLAETCESQDAVLDNVSETIEDFEDQEASSSSCLKPEEKLESEDLLEPSLLDEAGPLTECVTIRAPPSQVQILRVTESFCPTKTVTMSFQQKEHIVTLQTTNLVKVSLTSKSTWLFGNEAPLEAQLEEGGLWMPQQFRPEPWESLEDAYWQPTSLVDAFPEAQSSIVVVCSTINVSLSSVRASSPRVCTSTMLLTSVSVTSIMPMDFSSQSHQTSTSASASAASTASSSLSVSFAIKTLVETRFATVVSTSLQLSTVTANRPVSHDDSSPVQTWSTLVSAGPLQQPSKAGVSRSSLTPTAPQPQPQVPPGQQAHQGLHEPAFPLSPNVYPVERAYIVLNPSRMPNSFVSRDTKMASDVLEPQASRWQSNQATSRSSALAIPASNSRPRLGASTARRLEASSSPPPPVPKAKAIMNPAFYQHWQQEHSLSPRVPHQRLKVMIDPAVLRQAS